MPSVIPATLWHVFSTGWLSIHQAPADAADWAQQGYLRLVQQGHVVGYAIAPMGYAWIVGVY